MWHEFEVSNTLYSDPDKNGNQRIIKQGVISRIMLDIDRIAYPEELLTKDGKLIKGRCAVKYMDEPITLNHSFKEVCTLLKKHPSLNPVFIKGFKRYDQRRKPK